MDNTKPVPDPNEPEIIPPPSLEVHPRDVPPVEYLEADERPGMGLLLLVRSLWGEVILGVLAAGLVGGVLWHFTHHHKPAPPAVVHTHKTHTLKATHKHHLIPKKTLAKPPASKTKSKTKKKASPSSHTSKSDANSNQKEKSRPWFS